jgi:hypothetical protein
MSRVRIRFWTWRRWLADEAEQPFYRIDPLKISVAAVTPLMSFAFAQRHSILALDVNEREVVVASAQPFVSSWETNLVHVLKREIRRVVASPADIQRYSVEFFRLARSVTGANATDQFPLRVSRGGQPAENTGADECRREAQAAGWSDQDQVAPG